MRSAIVLLILFQGLIGFSQSDGFEAFKIPFLKHYTKKDYTASSQNWAIIQGANQKMYFANNQGVMSFNGINWQIIEMPNKSAVRCLSKYNGDTLLAGAYSEFGELFYDKYGNLEYKSWSDQIPAKDLNVDEIWRIHKLNDTVIFQSFHCIFIFKNRSLLKVINSPGSFKHSFVVNSKIFIQKINEGIFELKGLDLVKISGSEFFIKKEIWSLFQYKKNTLLIGTQNDGFYTLENGIVTPWVCEANQFITENNLFQALRLKTGEFVFGSIQNGIIITDSLGNILQTVNTANGLQNNTVLSLYEDHEGNLWAGLDNGIDYIIINSSLSYVRKKDGFGTGYASIFYNNTLYCGTNQGVYFTQSIKNNYNRDFELINKTRGQVWNFEAIDDVLYCCHNNGLFIIEGSVATKLDNIAGVWNIAPIPSNLNELIIGTYDGFYLYNKKTRTVEKLKGFNESARKFYFYSENELLMSHGYKGVYKMKVNFQERTISVTDFFDKNTFPTSFGNELFKFRNELIVTTSQGVYRFDAKRTFVLDSIWDNFFQGGAAGLTNIMELDDTKFLAFKNGKVYHITYLNDKMYEVNSNEFLKIQNTFPRSFENLSQIGMQRYLIGNEDGFVLYEEKSIKKEPFNIAIDLASVSYKNKKTNKYEKAEILRHPKHLSIKPLEYKMNKLKFIISMPFYIDQGQVSFRYRLNNGPWSDWMSGNELLLDDYPEGTYYLDVQCSTNKTDIAGNLNIQFTIKPPIYRAWYAFIFYLLLFFTLALIVNHFAKQRILYEKRRAAIKQKKLMIEKEIRLKQKHELAQKEIIELRNERLKDNIRNKSKELANTTMSIIQKNKILQQINSALYDIKKDDAKYRDNVKINNLIKKINREIEHDDNWTVFDQNFDNVHESFFIKLKERHIDLTPKDLRLAAYLKMNLSSKEIAPLLNISIRSIEISRYRLRKKMNLDHDQNLTEYLIAL